MDDDEIEELIAALRSLLDANGFGWAREQAESVVDPRWHRRWLATALLNAAENVTVDLAEVELSMLDAFGYNDVRFERDDGAEPDGDFIAPDERRATMGGGERLRGTQRRGALQELAGMRHAFEMLRERLDGAD